MLTIIFEIFLTHIYKLLLPYSHSKLTVLIIIYLSTAFLFKFQCSLFLHYEFQNYYKRNVVLLAIPPIFFLSIDVYSIFSYDKFVLLLLLQLFVKMELTLCTYNSVTLNRTCWHLTMWSFNLYSKISIKQMVNSHKFVLLNVIVIMLHELF